MMEDEEISQLNRVKEMIGLYNMYLYLINVMNKFTYSFLDQITFSYKIYQNFVRSQLTFTHSANKNLEGSNNFFSAL